MMGQIRVEHAARLIFRRRTVDDTHRRQVVQWLTRGEIRGELHGKTWYTTEHDVAEWIVQKTIPDQQEESPEVTGQPVASRAIPQSELVRIYRESLTDYLLGVFLRRRKRDATLGWRRAVLVGQTTFVALVALSLLVMVVQFVQPAPVEQRAIERWLAQNYTEGYAVVSISDPLSSSSEQRQVIPVTFSYKSRNRGKIQTVQYFVLQDEEVISVDSEL
jgi:hypothetical protein